MQILSPKSFIYFALLLMLICASFNSAYCNEVLKSDSLHKIHTTSNNVEEIELEILSFGRKPASIHSLNSDYSVIRVLEDSTIDFTLGFHVRNTEILDNLFWEISDPDSAQYSRYLSVPNVQETFGRKPTDIDLVLSWLKSYLSPVDSYGNVIGGTTYEISKCSTGITVKSANLILVSKLFSIDSHSFFKLYPKSSKLSHFKHTKPLIRCIGQECDPKIPKKISKIVSVVEGLVDLPISKIAPHIEAMKQPLIPNARNTTPADLYAHYNVPKIPDWNVNKSSQAVVEFSSSTLQYFNPEDLDYFQTHFGLKHLGVAKIEGKNEATKPAQDASVDIQWIMASAQGVPTWYWSESGTFVDYLLRLEGNSAAPPVQSISYTIGEESSLDTDYLKFLNTHFQMIAVTGKSLIWASGDDGVGSSGFFSCSKFSPSFPASSPYVTSVGATYYNSSSDNAEIAASYSGGGFSFKFATPDYQKTQVLAYLSSNGASLPPQQLWNKNGRGLPDVAMAGTNFGFFVAGWRGAPLLATGTSCSTPAFAGLIALVNSKRAVFGKPPLGFLNPALYKAPTSAFNFITSGSNPSGPCKQGFQASAGWSPITGLGTPNFSKLVDYLFTV